MVFALLCVLFTIIIIIVIIACFIRVSIYLCDEAFSAATDVVLPCQRSSGAIRGRLCRRRRHGWLYWSVTRLLLLLLRLIRVQYYICCRIQSRLYSTVTNYFLDSAVIKASDLLSRGRIVLDGTVVFTARRMLAMYSCRNSVCSSIHLSDTRVLCDKIKEATADIFKPRERSVLLVFFRTNNGC